MDGCQFIERVAAPALSIPAPRAVRKALLVVGMSRSGTSLLTHALHALGAALPRDLMGAGYGNPLGHFEPLGLVALNDEILRGLGRSWNDPRPIPASWFRSRAAYEFLERVIALLRQSYGDAPLLVIKDPRLCRLLPLYLDALDVLDIEPLVILQVRPVAEVVQSLVDRDEIQPALAEFLWLRSLVEAEWQSRNCPRVWVSMADMLADWPDVLGRIADGLRLEWPIGVDEASAEIAALVKPRLYHRVAPAPEEDAARRFCASAWAAAGHGLAGDEPAARAAFDAVRCVLHDLDRMYAPYVRARDERQVPWYRRLAPALRMLRCG